MLGCKQGNLTAHEKHRNEVINKINQIVNQEMKKQEA